MNARRDLRSFVFGDDQESNPSKDNQPLEQFLSVEEITLPASQPRRYFDTEKLAQLSESIRVHGVIEPLLVRVLPGRKFELVAGERRLRASKMAGLKTVPVIIREISDENALVISLVENLQREELNSLEETEAILQLLGIKLKMEVEQVVKLLYQMGNEAKGKVTHNVVGNSDFEEIESLFSALGKLSWQSFVKHRLPVRKLPEEIKEALMAGQIEYTKALAISRIKDESDRGVLLSEAIEHSLSLTEIKQRIASFSAKTQPTTNILKTKVDETLKNLKKSDIWDNPNKQKKLEELLKEIDKLMT